MEGRREGGQGPVQAVSLPGRHRPVDTSLCGKAPQVRIYGFVATGLGLCSRLGVCHVWNEMRRPLVWPKTLPLYCLLLFTGQMRCCFRPLWPAHLPICTWVGLLGPQLYTDYNGRRPADPVPLPGIQMGWNDRRSPISRVKKTFSIVPGREVRWEERGEGRETSGIAWKRMVTFFLSNLHSGNQLEKATNRLVHIFLKTIWERNLHLYWMRRFRFRRGLYFYFYPALTPTHPAIDWLVQTLTVSSGIFYKIWTRKKDCIIILSPIGKKPTMQANSNVLFLTPSYKRVSFVAITSLL